MSIPGGSIGFPFVVTNPSTGVAVNADSLPTVPVTLHNGVSASVTWTVTNVGTGLYWATATVPSGWALGDYICQQPYYLVGGVAIAAPFYEARLANTADNATVVTIASGALTAIAGAVWNAVLATYNAAGSFGAWLQSLVNAPTASANATAAAAAILATPSQLLATNASGYVTFDNTVAVPLTSAQTTAAAAAALPADYLSATERTQLAAASTATGGTGPNAIIVPVTNGTTGLENVQVSVTDQNGTKTGPVLTDSSGNAAFNLANGTYTPAALLSGWTVTVAPAAQSVTTSLTMTTIVMSQNAVPTPPNGTIIGFAYTRRGGANVGGVPVQYYTSAASAGTGEIVNGDLLTAVSDSNGLLEIVLDHGVSCTIVGSPNVTFPVPTTGTGFAMPNVRVV